MRSRIAFVALLLAALLFAGCQGKQVEHQPAPQTTPQVTPTEQQTEQIIEDVNITKDLQELEQLLQELESLDNVEFNV
ncbi:MULTISPECIES: hypothetical protein [Archaeoglobus]|jgi:PBP1b-binding outer membrane lipoprotein LpoB|uniref:Uncharacterized protein n=2 Tax=Archaeoglobus fulgidus TaxID=2234 RepID=A0A075WCZ8_ARCFL|nr:MULTISPECIES: hypothetical protein [Archaeoglobus]AIG98290.1 hypothetical protein AFULGI_00015240 [Archaeoglobus fulgidus DSM 8774]KUJ94470.1 MAG: hypothetical protein XD40_0406 [Archaeoglobus fulgidus]KUK05908.1 MAG: Uncharacterized protein XD48_1854 [Archaeoglobus fulgidus]MDI3498717.1 hypothetical protein [Archaeoglobus sp.]